MSDKSDSSHFISYTKNRGPTESKKADVFYKCSLYTYLFLNFNIAFTLDIKSILVCLLWILSMVELIYTFGMNVTTLPTNSCKVE